MENEVRKARAADHAALIGVAEACEGAPQWSAALWTQVLQSAQGANPLRVIFVVPATQSAAQSAAAQGLAGFGVVRILSETAEIESVGVLPSTRRQGWGTRLCQALLQAAGEAGVRKVQLEVRSQNTAARSLYQRLGFTEEGIRQGYYHDPEDAAVLMSLTLEKACLVTARKPTKESTL